MWDTAHSQHPMRKIGLDIIDALIQKQEAYIIPKQYTFIEQPTEADLMVDMATHEEFFYSVTSEPAEDATFAKFIRGWMSQRPAKHPPLTAFNVRCRSEDGLKGCMGDVPIEFNRDGVSVCCTGENGEVEWSLVITPAYHITRPHIDECGLGQTILDVLGVKVVYWFVYSEEVMRIFKDIYCLHRGDYSLMAIESWPGLRWTILDPGAYIDMEPGTIHGVISPVNSAVSGWLFMDPKWLSDGILRKMIMWELDIVEKRMNSQVMGSDSLEGILGTIKDGLEHWRAWLENPALEKKDKSIIRTLKKEVEDRVRKLELMLQ